VAYNDFVLPPTLLSCIHAPSIINTTYPKNTQWFLENSLSVPFTEFQMITPGHVSNFLGLIKQ